MEIIGLSRSQWVETVEDVGADLYGGNLRDNDTNEKRTSRSVRVTGTIRARDSRGPGARRSGSGRRGPWACWHAHRDVFREVFERYPEARINTAMAHYTADNFEETFPETANRNVGSMVRPAYMDNLCECEA
jgi:hypothetical protein